MNYWFNNKNTEKIFPFIILRSKKWLPFEKKRKPLKIVKIKYL